MYSATEGKLKSLADKVCILVTVVSEVIIIDSQQMGSSHFEQIATRSAKIILLELDEEAL